jgi:alkaline phosphatase D
VAFPPPVRLLAVIAVSPSSTVFRHGVASGDPRSDRVVIWTRVTSPGNEPVNVLWEAATEPDFQCVIATGSAEATVGSDFTVHIDVAGLGPSTQYFYRFTALNQTSPVGRTKTLPIFGAPRVRFAVACCAKLNVGYFNAYACLAEREDLDFFLHLGDYIYETAEHATAHRLSSVVPERAYDPPQECRTLGDYRGRYAQYRLDSDLQRLHQALPMFATLDDHEIADGAWRDGSQDHEEDRDGAWAVRRQAALRARWEWLPLRRPDPNNAEQSYSSIVVADLLDLILIDTRTQRDRPHDGVGVQDPQRTALGRRQRAWLLDELDASNAMWRIIGSPTLMATLANDALPAACHQALRTLKVVNPRDGGPDSDPWSGYPHERNEILRHVRDRAPDNVVVLSGDVHFSLAAELQCSDEDGAGAPIAVEFVTPSVTSQNLDDKMGWPPRTESPPIEQALVDWVPGLQWCELDSHGYLLVEVTREQVRAEWWFVDAIATPSTDESCGAAWQVESGRPRLSAVPR